MDRNLPANAGDMGSIPGLGSMVWEDSTCCRATNPMCCNY